MREDYRGEKKNFLHLLRALAGSENLTDKNKLKGEKHACLFHKHSM